MYKFSLSFFFFFAFKWSAADFVSFVLAARRRRRPHPRHPRLARSQRACAAKGHLRPLERAPQLSAGARRRTQGSPARRIGFNSKQRRKGWWWWGGCARHGGGGSDRERFEEKIGEEEWVIESFGSIM